jgi:glycosyltransferase involved in cell wall biosynthesis
MSGLYLTQVFSILKKVKNSSNTVEITLISFWQPWVMYKYRSLIDQMKSELESENIKVINSPFAIIPSRHFFFKYYLFWIVELWGKIIFKYVLRNKNYDIVHCRAYFASYIASKILNNYNFKLIFDLRSIWPLENITVGNWKLNDKIYEKWIEIEKYTIKKSSFSIGVTEPIVEYINKVYPDKKGVLIPITVDTSFFKFNQEKRVLIRNKYSFKDKFVICFQGSLGRENQWNNIFNYAEYFKEILKEIKNAFLLILTENIDIGIDNVMNSFGVPKSNYLVKTPLKKELPFWLSSCDAGIHVMSKGPDSHTRLGVKVVEYISCGLPLLVNKNVGAAANIARKHNLGVVLDTKDKESFKNGLGYIQKHKATISSNCRNFSEEVFSLKRVSDQYLNLYKNCK